MGDLIPLFAIAAFAYMLTGVVRIISDGITRRRLIATNPSAELASAIQSGNGRDTALHDSLRWGLVVGSIGLALIIVQFLPFHSDEPIVYGVVLLFGAVGLLGYYVIARRMGTTAAITSVPS